MACHIELFSNYFYKEIYKFRGTVYLSLEDADVILEKNCECSVDD